MPIASVIVEIQSGSGEIVLSRLGQIPKTSVYGMTDKQIVAVIESDRADTLDNILKEVGAMEGVAGVYPCLYHRT